MNVIKQVDTMLYMKIPEEREANLENSNTIIIN
jgi:hypothetical protein